MKIFEFLFSKEVIYTILIIFSAFIIYFFSKKFTKQIFNVKAKKIDINKKNTMCSLIINIEKYFFIIIPVLMILGVYGVDTVTLVASLGVVGISVGLAVQDTLKDFISAIFIIFENQYCVGDAIMGNDFKGLGINKLGSSSVKYNIVVDTYPMGNWSVERMMRKEFKIILDKNKIQIPYNQVVINNAK